MNYGTVNIMQIILCEAKLLYSKQNAVNVNRNSRDCRLQVYRCINITIEYKRRPDNNFIFTSRIFRLQAFV